MKISTGRRRIITVRRGKNKHRAKAVVHRRRSSLYNCKSAGALPGRVTSAGERKLSAMGSSRVRIAPSIVMVSPLEPVGSHWCANCHEFWSLTSFIECSYDQPSNRRRNPAPQYIEAIEIRLHRAEALLKTVLPHVDLNDSKYDVEPVQVPFEEHKSESGNDGRILKPTVRSNNSGEVEKDSMLESMVKNTGSLDLDDRGFWDFHGHSSGLVFLRRMREQFGDMMGETEAQGTPFVKPRSSARTSFVFDSPSSAGDSPMESNVPNTHDLPSKTCARELSEATLTEACAIFRFIHQPTFWVQFNNIYETPPDRYGNDENRFLPLLYMVLAVGCLFAQHEQSKLKHGGYENAIDQGLIFRYSQLPFYLLM